MKTARAAIALSASVVVLFASSVQAATNTISAIIPWQGQGQLFPIDVNKLRFLGALEGIMYVETADGDMNEAFVRCPIVQDVDAEHLSISASGNCEIAVSGEDSVYAEMSCKGVAGFCEGRFTLISGTGRFVGIKGSGKMTIRSPIHALAADTTDGTLVHAAAGLLQIPELKVTLP